MPLTIHSDLYSLIPPLTREEFAQLEANVLADGCRDPLIVWQEEQVLLDGHNRHVICERHGITYQLQEISLPDMDAAKAWMITNQLGRRNLTPEQMSYYRGEQYNLQKRQGKRTDLTSHHSDGRSQKTAQVLAAQHKVGPATIERDGAYAEAVETLAAVLGSEVRHAILAGDLHLTRPDVRLLATLVQTSPETAQAVREAVQGTDPALALRAILQAVRCGICGRPLCDPASVSRGIGPICAGHGNGASRHAQSLSTGASSSLPILTAAQEPEPPVLPANGLAACFQQALQSLADLRSHLKAVAIPEDLGAHVDTCIAFGEAYRQVDRLITEHPAVLNALYGRPPAAASPADPRPTIAHRQDPALAEFEVRINQRLQTLDKKVSLPVAVLAMVKRLQPCTNAQVANALKRPRNKVHEALQSLVKQHKVAREGQTYRVAEVPA